MTLSQEVRYRLGLARLAVKNSHEAYSNGLSQVGYNLWHEGLQHFLYATEAFEHSQREQLEYQLDALCQSARELRRDVERWLTPKSSNSCFWALPWGELSTEEGVKDYFACKVSRGVAELACINLEMKEIERKLFV